MLCVRTPLVPVTVIGYSPGATAVVVAMVKVDEAADVVTLLGVKVAVAPEGKPVAERLTLPVKAPCGNSVVE